jgi:hypothetical protein
MKINFMNHFCFKIFFLIGLMLFVSLSFSQAQVNEIHKAAVEVIEKLHPDNQAEAHKTTINRVSEELQILASSNINKYNKNARSEAYKASIATKKPKVIAAANGSLDKVNWEGVDKSLRVDPNSYSSITTTTRTTCSNCNGSGKQTCNTCSGYGKLKCTCCNGTGIFTAYYSQVCNCCMGTGGTNCYDCYGLGWKSCGQCYGSGYVSSYSSSYTTQQTSASSAKIEKVWVEHNVYQNGQKGMKIHVKFSADNMLGRQGSVAAWFYYENGNKLILTAHNGVYTTPDKQVAVADRFTPGYVNTVYNDFVLFLPNNAIPNLGKGTHSLKFKVGVVNEGVEIAASEFQEFTMSW